MDKFERLVKALEQERKYRLESLEEKQDREGRIYERGALHALDIVLAVAEEIKKGWAHAYPLIHVKSLAIRVYSARTGGLRREKTTS